MRAAAVIDESQHSSYMDFYTDMYDKQLSQNMSQNGGIGIAAMLQRQLDPGSHNRQQAAAGDGNSLPTYRLTQARSDVLPVRNMDYIAQNPQVKTHHLSESVQSNEVKPERALQSTTIKFFVISVTVALIISFSLSFLSLKSFSKRFWNSFCKGLLFFNSCSLAIIFF